MFLTANGSKREFLVVVPLLLVDVALLHLVLVLTFSKRLLVY